MVKKTKHQKWLELRRELVKVGWNSVKLAEKLKLSPAAIYRRAERYGYDLAEEKQMYIQKVKRLRAEQLRDAMEKTGYNLGKVAKVVGISEKILRQRVVRLPLKKEVGARTPYATKLPISAMNRLKAKLAHIEAKKNISFSASECLRVSFVVFSRFSEDRIFRLCMRERRSNWRIKPRYSQAAKEVNGGRAGGSSQETV